MNGGPTTYVTEEILLSISLFIFVKVMSDHAQLGFGWTSVNFARPMLDANDRLSFAVLISYSFLFYYFVNSQNLLK